MWWVPILVLSQLRLFPSALEFDANSVYKVCMSGHSHPFISPSSLWAEALSLFFRWPLWLRESWVLSSLVTQFSQASLVFSWPIVVVQPCTSLLAWAMLRLLHHSVIWGRPSCQGLGWQFLEYELPFPSQTKSFLITRESPVACPSLHHTVLGCHEERNGSTI